MTVCSSLSKFVVQEAGNNVQRRHCVIQSLRQDLKAGADNPLLIDLLAGVWQQLLTPSV